jgi:uncharacterized protein YigE (DUF2233 family)
MNRAHIFLALTLCATLAIPGIAAPEKRDVNGVTCHILRVDPAAIRLVWKSDEGEILRTFPAAAAHLRQQGLTPAVLMNGGIFEPGGVPSGLLVQDGKTTHPVNRNHGDGNFYLLPNGIFLIGSKGAAVIGTVEYPPGGVDVLHAVQSGPLLLRRGTIHPAFNAGSANFLHRNGVGVDQDGKVVFVMTDIDSPKLPNLHQFATIFLALGCKDALFLDGDISQMRTAPDLDRASNRFGSIIAVINR